MFFSEYMNGWLYGDGGYYKTFKAIGKGGDFYTAVSTSSFFGASIANFLYRGIKSGEYPKDTTLIEIGAHQGYLICDMIQWLYTCDASLINTMQFVIIERQPEVQKAQREYITSRFGDDVKVKILGSLEELECGYGFVVANEIFDAFGCELIKDGMVASVEEGAIVWSEAPEPLIEKAKKYRQIKGEVAVGYEAFALEVASSLPNCDFVSFDYGERYVRNDFSVRIYKGHETFPLFDEGVVLADEFGRSDITYDVNFDHVIDAFRGAGFTLIECETQARALVRFGLIELLESFAHTTTQANYLRVADKIKTLIAPTMMGDRFKMVHLRRRS